MKLVGSDKGIRSPEFHKKKQRERILKASLWVLGALIILAAPIFGLRYQKFLITDIETTGNQVTTTDEIAAIAREEMSGNYLWLLPKSNDLLVPKSSIEKRLITQIPRLSSVEVGRKGMNTLNIAVTERSPFALYCEDVSDPKNPSKCYFLDETGNIFSKAPDFSGEVYMLYASEPVAAEPMRTQLIEPQEFNAIDVFVKSLPKLGIHPEVVVKRGSEYALVLAGGAEMKWRESQNLDNLYRDLESFLKDPKTKKLAFGDLLYIDLRFDNKIYWLPK